MSTRRQAARPSRPTRRRPKRRRASNAASRREQDRRDQARRVRRRATTRRGRRAGRRARASPTSCRRSTSPSPAAKPTSRSRRSSWRPTTAAAASSRASRRSSPAAIPASAAPSRCCSRAKAPTSPIAYLDEHDDADETKRCIEAEGRRCLLVAGDVKEPTLLRSRSSTKTLEAFGRLDVLVNNAAFQEHAESIEDITDERLEETFRTNIFGYFHMAQGGAAAPEAGRLDHQHRLGHRPRRAAPKLLDYSATKGAIHAFTKSLAQNLIDKGIRVNAVAPGPVWTPLNPADSPAEKVAEVRRRHRDEAAGAARGAVAGLRLPRLAGVRRLHHRHRAAGDRQRRRDLRRRGAQAATRLDADRLLRLGDRLPRPRVVAPRRRRAPRCARARSRSSSGAAGERAELVPRARHARRRGRAAPAPTRRRPWSRRSRCAGSRRRSCRRGSSARSWRRSARGSSSAMCSTMRLGERLDGVPVVLRRDRHDDVQALAAAGLEEARQAELVEQRARQLGAFLHLLARRRLRPGRGRRRCGRGAVVSSRGRVPGVELDHVGLRRADQRRERVDLDHRLVVGRDRRVELAQLGDAQACRRGAGRRAWPAMPAGARTSETGRLTRCGRISRATSR